MAERDSFEGLSVTFHWSEVPIKDFHGNRYPNDEDLVLTGEKAYEFLVQLNAKDKEAFEQRTQGHIGYDKTKVDISVHGFDMRGLRIDLGDLEFRNAKNIADALFTRLVSYDRYLLRHPKALAAEGDATKEDCYADLAACKDATDKLREQEAAYLKGHPEIQAINEKEPSSFYTYVADKDSFSKCKAYDTVIRELPSEKLDGCMPLPSLPKSDDRSFYRYDGLDFVSLSHIDEELKNRPQIDGLILFASHCDPEHLAYSLRDAGRTMVRPVISEEEVKAIQTLNKNITFEESLAFFDDREEDHVTPKFGEPQVYRGINAVYEFARKANCRCASSFFTRRRLALQLGEQKFQKEYLLASSLEDPVRKVLGNRNFPEIPDELKTPFQTAWGVLVKYGDVDNLPKLVPDHILSDAPASMQDYQEKLRKDLELYGRDLDGLYQYDKAILVNYYLNYAAADLQNDTPEKVIRNAFQHMAEDGLDKRKAKTLMNHVNQHPSYYKDIAAKLLSKDKELQTAFKNNGRSNKITR